AGIAAAKAEDVTPLDEERALLLEERLVYPEVDDCRIDFDLAEIRVDRRVERHVARHAVTRVETGGELVLCIRAERIRAGIDVLAAPHDIRQQLEALARGDARHAEQVTVRRDAAPFRL